MALKVLNPPKPQHTHDCEECILIANLGKDDVYVCNDGVRGEDSLVIRDGSDGPEYTSFPVTIARMAADSSMDWDLRVRLYDAFQAGRESL